MKVRIQQGSSSIEIEGEQSEVSAVLERWWNPTAVYENGDETLAEQTGAPTPKRRAPKRSSTRPSGLPRESASKLNAENVANQMKEDPRFEVFRTRFILGDASRSDRAKFVSWFVGDTPITSGDVSRVMTAIGVKFDGATASRAMSDSTHDWIKDSSGPQTTFRLSASARHSFEQKVLNAKPAA